MTEKKDKLLIDLEVRVKQVLTLCDILRNENARLKEEIQSQQNQLTQAEETFFRLKTKYDSLKTARTITAASVDVDTARAKLSEMVREVDKCINLLK
jgi:dynactin complex subunit